MIKEFLQSFGDIRIENIKKVGKKFYQQDPALAKIVDDMDDYPTSAGLFLGEIEKNKFIPSPSLLNIINVQTQKRIVLNEKSAWLFVCGRDVFAQGITNRFFGKGNVIVLNEKSEVLGVVNKQGKEYSNVYDIGALLRRERKKKRKK